MSLLIKQGNIPHMSNTLTVSTLIIILPLGPGCLGPGVGVSVSLTAATAAKDRQPWGGESSRAALLVILGAARCAPQRERRPGARLLQCPA